MRLILKKNLIKLLEERGYESAWAFFKGDVIQRVDKELQPTEKTLEVYNEIVRQYIADSDGFHKFDIDLMLKTADLYLDEDVEALIYEKFADEIAAYEVEKQQLEQEKQETYEANKSEREAQEALAEAIRMEESKNRLYIGMSTYDVLATTKWNDPDDINKTTDAYGVSEQWIYRDYDTYLYFEDGILTTIQE